MAFSALASLPVDELVDISGKLWSVYCFENLSERGGLFVIYRRFVRLVVVNPFNE